MKKTMLPIAIVTAVGLGVAAASAATLEDVKSKGFVQCGANASGLAGFATTNDKGEWNGFDVDYCRAYAAAIFGDPSKVKFTPLTAKERFTALQSGSVDVLVRNTTWTMSRDTQLGLNFTGVSYYDGQGFMVRKDLGVTSVKQLKGATVCVLTGTSSELNLADYSRTHGLDLKTVVFDDSAVRNTAFFNDNCDALTNDKSGLAAQRSAAPNPADYVVLPETISKEALSFAVKQNDSEWANVVKWTFQAMVAAEEYGITSENVDDMRANSESPIIRRILGVEGDLHVGLGLPQDWAYQVIKNVGNYGEIYERNVGPDSVLGLDREGTLNALWQDGGLMYAKSFR